MDLVAVHQVQGELSFVKGTGKGQRKIDVHERCSAITNFKARGLVGLPAFFGADWGGKFAGVSRKRWLECHLSLEADNEIVAVFHRLGKAEFNLSRDLTILENFKCVVFSRSDQQRKLSDLRWELFRTKKPGE